MNNIKRIGFACKFIDFDRQINGSILENDECKKYNNRHTTVSALNKKSKSDVEEKLWNLMQQNILALSSLIYKISTLDESLRMIRITSDLLPMYSHPIWNYFWKRPDVVKYLETNLAKIGIFARMKDIRLSFHPGQFCVLSSDKDDVINSSIDEFEYHVDLARYMGYGKNFQDIKINIHLQGRGGEDVFRKSYLKLSTEGRNLITVENDENSCNIDDCLRIFNIVPIVIDLHHQWINTGEYFKSTDYRCNKIIDSWRGIRPTLHYSISREDLLVGHPIDILPDMSRLSNTGYSKQKLRAHSDKYWNNACNQWALSFNDKFDIMCESKGKNLSSFQLYKEIKKCFNE